MKKINVLMILPTFEYAGGIESFVMNNVRRLSKNVNVDVLSHCIKAEKYKEEIIKRGGNVFDFSRFSLSTVSEIKKKFDVLLDKNKYDIVHCNMANAAFLYLKIAKQHNVKMRIIHSHQERAADTFLHSLRNYPLLALGKRYSNLSLACSQNAGRFLFKGKKFIEINNGIDYDKYRFSNEYRSEIRKEFNLSDDEIAIVHTGRFCPQKNQMFLLEIFKAFHQKNKYSKLFLIGDGDDKEKIQRWIKENSMGKCVKIIGLRTDVEKILSAMDFFLFPSLYEGLPISMLEAQAASLPCVCSDSIPQEVDISGNVTFVSLDAPIEEWVSDIEKAIADTKRSKEIALRKEHSIDYGVEELYNVYKKVMSDKKRR